MKIKRTTPKTNPPLPSSVINIQLRAFMRNEYKSPNCDSGQFIESVGLCHPDAFCMSKGVRTIKNPIAYPFRVMNKKRKEQMQVEIKEKKKEKPKLDYKCSRCDSAYAGMKGLNMHISRSHGEI